MTKNRHGIKFVALFLVFTMLASLLPVTALAASAEWQIKDDTEIYWVETTDSKITDTDLKAQVQLFAQEMQAKELTKQTLGISYGAESLAGDNDIVLKLDSSLKIADEGYQISMVNGQLWVKASDADGLFYGCRFVEQALLAGTGLNRANNVTVKPDYPERAFFLDCARKYYSPSWIEDMIREISWSNMNAIYIHFSEEMGFRLESKTYPWLAGGDNTLCIGGSAMGVAADNRKYITQYQMRQIAKVAKLYHVEIIPSLDSPGHMNYAVKKYNAVNNTDIGNYFHYKNKTSIVHGSGSESAQTDYSRGIDISNTEAVIFAKNLYAEYAAFFRELGCTKFDIGGDELLGWGSAVVSTDTASRWKQLDHWKAYAQKRSGNSKAVAYDAFMFYMNDIYDLVKGYGYTSIRMWNDDALRSSDTGWKQVVTLNPGMEIQYWSKTADKSIWDYMSKYKLYNFLSDYNYYVVGQAHNGTGKYKGVTQQRIYENWAPNVFTTYEGVGTNTAIGNANVKGSAFCVWCDQPAMEKAAEVKEGLIPRLRVNGAKAWDADLNSTISYSRAQQLLAAIGNVPTNLPAAPEVKQYVKPDMTALAAAIAAYDAADSTLYTADTWAAYTAAVEKGKTVLNAKKPTQAEVNMALSAINTAEKALVSLGSTDFTKLNEALETFDSVDKSLYTEETYKAYKVYADDAKALKTNKDVTQEQMDAAVERLVYLHSQLRRTDMVATGNNWFISFAVKSKKAGLGKAFVFTTYLQKGSDVAGFEIYDENGQRVEPRVFGLISPAKLKNKKEGAQLSINAEVRGKHTYTIYAVNKDGLRSPDCRSLTVTVR